MTNLIVQLSKYIQVLLIIIYTIYAFTAFRAGSEKKKNRLYLRQQLIIFALHTLGHALLFLNTREKEIIVLYVIETLLFIGIFVLYQKCYRNLSRLLLNNMVLLLAVGFVILTRLSLRSAKRQLLIVAVSLLICLVIPYLVDKMKVLSRFGWLYFVAGIGMLMLVFVCGVEHGGATNWVRIAGFEFQPSEIVKIIFVFFAASLLVKKQNFAHIALVTVAAAVHVLILVAETDLGGALLFFVTYLLMLYVATANPLYPVVGLAAGGVAAVAAYKIFPHIRTRVKAWRDPWSFIDTGGYQVAQSLFAIGTGGWFGMGLGKGMPQTIPVVTSDFIFSAISEELGAIFAICIILIYISCFLMFINIAMKVKQPFYKLVALGLSTSFIFQVLLTIGGATKFIPSTGVTLPFISYGGTSIISSAVIFSVIQGLYVLNQSEERKK